MKRFASTLLGMLVISLCVAVLAGAAIAALRIDSVIVAAGIYVLAFTDHQFDRVAERRLARTKPSARLPLPR